MRLLLTLISLSFLSVPALAYAQEPSTTPEIAPVTECVTPAQVANTIVQNVPDADIKSVSETPPYLIVFTSPSLSTDLVTEFDNNGCLINVYEVSKVKA